MLFPLFLILHLINTTMLIFKRKCINPTSTMTKGKRYKVKSVKHWDLGGTHYKIVNDYGNFIWVVKERFK